MLQRIAGMPLTILSPAFDDHAPIPALHTCDGDDAAPPLGWSAPPPHTTTFLSFIVLVPHARGKITQPTPEPRIMFRPYTHTIARFWPPGRCIAALPVRFLRRSRRAGFVGVTAGVGRRQNYRTVRTAIRYNESRVT